MRKQRYSSLLISNINIENGKKNSDLKYVTTYSVFFKY
jgi:hypothetical protein